VLVKFSVTLLESICFINGMPRNAVYHQQRVQKSLRKFFPETDYSQDFFSAIPVPDVCKKGIYKCRVSYQDEILDVSFGEYQVPQIKTLQMVYSDEIEYEYKYLDRSLISELFEKRGTADDILIIRNGLLTDTSYANICLWHPERGWCTPMKPLLQGTMRASLLSENSIHPMDIRPEMLPDFEKVSLVNAMLLPGDLEIPVSGIRAV
jgi:4-amino-4-deoxychorismate lyase